MALAGWRRKDPFRGFLAPSGLEAERSVSGISCLLVFRRGAHRAGGGKIRLGPGTVSLLDSGAHWAGGGKIRLGNFLLLGEALTGLEAERSVSDFLLPRAGGGKIRLGDFLLAGEALTGLEAARSVSDLGI